MKTVVIISDLHCGSTYGITPPDEWKSPNKEIQEEAWNEYCRIANMWNSPDILIVNGDAIEGNQSRQGGAELLTPDRTVQGDMAVTAISKLRAKNTFMTYGTPYHVGEKAEDFERGIAKDLKAKIEGRLYLNVEGVILDVRHKIGTSAVPHGRATAILREMMWALIKEANETGPHVDVIVRSHAHYNISINVPGKKDMRRAIITPGLQLARGRFGSRECSGETHWGAIRLTVDKGQVIKEEVEICTLNANKPRIFKVK